MPYNTKYDLDKSGLNKNYDMTAFVGPRVILNKYDKITHDSKTYMVDSISTRDFNGTTIMQKAMLYFLSSMDISESASPSPCSDFGLGPLSDFGVTATRTPVTVTTDFNGNKTYTDGTDEDISIVIQPYDVKYDLDKSGLNKNYDMMAYIGPTSTLNKYDKITYDSKVYRVDNVSTRDFDGTRIMKKAMLYFNDE